MIEQRLDFNHEVPIDLSVKQEFNKGPNCKRIRKTQANIDVL